MLNLEGLEVLAMNYPNVRVGLKPIKFEYDAKEDRAIYIVVEEGNGRFKDFLPYVIEFLELGADARSEVYIVSEGYNPMMDYLIEAILMQM